MPRHLVWVGAFALALGLLAVALPAPPVAARGADGAQVAKVREIITGLGYTETPYVPDSAGREVPALKVDGIGAPGLGDEIPPECQQIPIMSEAGPTVIGTQIAYDDRPGSMSPGDTRTYFTLYLFSTEYLDCANAWAKQQYDFMSGKWPTVPGQRPVHSRRLTGGRSARTTSARSWKPRGATGSTQMSGSDGTLNCGNIRVDLGNALMDSPRGAQLPRGADSRGEDKGQAEAHRDRPGARQRERLQRLLAVAGERNAGPLRRGPGLPVQRRRGRPVQHPHVEPARRRRAQRHHLRVDVRRDRGRRARPATRTPARTPRSTPGEHTDHRQGHRQPDQDTFLERALDVHQAGRRGSAGERGCLGRSGVRGPRFAGRGRLHPHRELHETGDRRASSNSEVIVVCEAKPSGQPVGGSLAYAWSWDGPPVPGATGSILTSQVHPARRHRHPRRHGESHRQRAARRRPSPPPASPATVLAALLHPARGVGRSERLPHRQGGSHAPRSLEGLRRG